MTTSGVDKHINVIQSDDAAKYFICSSKWHDIYLQSNSPMIH